MIGSAVGVTRFALPLDWDEESLILYTVVRRRPGLQHREQGQSKACKRDAHGLSEDGRASL
jgi:hypothetical protein